MIGDTLVSSKRKKYFGLFNHSRRRRETHWRSSQLNWVTSLGQEKTWDLRADLVDILMVQLCKNGRTRKKMKWKTEMLAAGLTRWRIPASFCSVRSGRRCLQGCALEIYRHFDNSVVGCCLCYHRNRLLKMGHVSLNWSYLHTNPLLLSVKSWNEFKACFSWHDNVTSAGGPGTERRGRRSPVADTRKAVMHVHLKQPHLVKKR